MRTKLTTTVCILLFCTNTSAQVVEYLDDDRDQWFIDVGGPENISTVDFTGFDTFTPVTDQWSHLGVNFSGLIEIIGPSSFAFPNDSWGVQAEPDINITFDEPMQWIAADFPGVISIELFMDGDSFYTSGILFGPDTNSFGGLISDQPFDQARIFDPLDAIVALDDLFFGPPIPAPGALAALLGGIVVVARRRHRS